jgi:hypothetical protein
VLLVSLHSLNLNHEAGKFEKVVLIEEFFFLNDTNRTVLLVLLDLNKDFVVQSIVAVLKHVHEIILNDFQ